MFMDFNTSLADNTFSKVKFKEFELKNTECLALFLGMELGMILFALLMGSLCLFLLEIIRRFIISAPQGHRTVSKNLTWGCKSSATRLKERRF